MKSQMYNLVSPIFLVLLVTSGGFGQSGTIDKVGTTSFQFLKVIPDARSTAMGEAYSAVVDNSTAAFWNPAALTKISKFDASLSYLEWLLDMKHHAFSLGYNFGNFGTIGIHAILTDIGDIEVTRVDNLFRVEEENRYNPGVTGETISPNSLVFGLSYARAVTERFAFGLTAKLAREDLVVASASTVMFDAGITYQTGFRSLELGATVRNFGPEVEYFNKSSPLPQTFSIGISGSVFASDSHLISQSDDHDLLLAVELSQTRDHSQQQLVGVEYALRNLLFLRGGYKFNFDEEGLTLGFGLKFRQYGLDYSYNDFGEFLDSVHRFTVAFSKN